VGWASRIGGVGGCGDGIVSFGEGLGGLVVELLELLSDAGLDFELDGFGA
jgi:hypothetical protein